MNYLTFDIEDWFHLLEINQFQDPSKWETLENRVESGTIRILELLDENETKATFFVLGWIAQKYPQLVKRISNAGHHIGSHTNTHQVLSKISEQEIIGELSSSKSIIEDVISKPVTSFRAPGFSINPRNNEIFWIMHDIGYRVDSSCFQGVHQHGGRFHNIPNRPFKMMLDSDKFIIEYPITQANIYRLRAYVLGGGYFRLTPKCIIKNVLDNNNYNMMYFHPRDFDAHQPRIQGLTLVRNFKSYVGLSRSFSKLEEILKHNSFNGICENNCPQHVLDINELCAK